jgi:hypothetical protein
MAFIDYTFIWSGKFAQLKPSSRILLHVITAVCNDKTGEFYHGVETLAHLSGLSERATRYALRELESHDPPIISAQLRPGKPDLKVHLPTVRHCHQRGATDAPPVLRGATDAPRGANNDTRGGQQMPPKNNKEQQELKTTTAADRISPDLIKSMTDIYGADIVSRVVVAMQSMDGEVRNANAYFRVCCEKNWTPTSKKARQKEEQKARKEAARERQEQEDREWQETRDQVLREAEDPEAQERIQKLIDETVRSLSAAD